MTRAFGRYHLKDVIVGKICFLLVRIKIKRIEPSIIRRDTTGSPPNNYHENETTTKLEIMRRRASARYPILRPRISRVLMSSLP